MSVQFAMLASPPPARAAVLAPAEAPAGLAERCPRLRAAIGRVSGDDGDAEACEEFRATLAGLVISGPGLWLDWHDDLRRQGLLERLLDDGVIDEALAQAGHDHKLDRTLNAKMTAVCVLVGCLFPGQGYDAVLKKAFALPGLPVKPGATAPTGPALSKARGLLGEQVMRKMFELDAARTDLAPGAGATWCGMETTAFDGRHPK